MPPHPHHHHGHHGGGGGGFGPGFGWGGGYDYPSTELVVLDDRDRDDKRILAYIASLPEKDRAKAFTKFFGNRSMSGALGDLQSMITDNWPFLLAGAIGLWFVTRKKSNPSRRRRRRLR